MSENWFTDFLNKLYHDLFTPGSSMYVPKVIADGYDDNQLNIHIQPRNSVTVPDIKGRDVGKPLPGGCALDFTNGNATFNGLNNLVTNFNSVGQGGPLVFSEQDSVIQLPLLFSAIILNGDLLATQPCEDANNNDYVKTWKGKYTVTASDLLVKATVTLSLGKSLSAAVGPIEVTEPQITITGTVEDPPPNLEQWWIQLANSPDVVGDIQKAIVSGLASPESARWIESVINPLLARISSSEDPSATPTERLVNSVWNYLWDPSADYYIPNLIEDSHAVPSQTNIDVGGAISGACLVTTSKSVGNGSLDLTEMSVSGLKGIVSGGPLQFVQSADTPDGQAKFSLSFESLTAIGDWQITQYCSDVPFSCVTRNVAALVAAPQSDLSPFYQVRTDLEKGSPGSKAQWYLQLYSQHSQEVIDLINNNPDVKAHIQHDKGPQIWRKIVDAIKSAQSGQPLPMPGADVQDGVLDILSVIQQVSADLAQMIQAVTPDIEWCEGKTYNEFLNMALTTPAPAQPPKPSTQSTAEISTARKLSDRTPQPVLAAATSGSYPLSATGSFQDSLSTITITLTCDLQSVGGVPKLNVSLIELQIEGIHFKITSQSSFADWVETWIANRFLENKVLSKLKAHASDSQVLRSITSNFNAGIQSFWSKLL